MALVKDWQDLEAQLPARWVEARIGFTLEEDRQAERALELLAPLQPMRIGPGVGVDPDRARGGGRGAERRVAAAGAPAARRRAASRPARDRRGRRGIRPPEVVGAHLPESWDAAVATLPADWSDLLGEIELDSSDYIEPAALNLAPINPRRVGNTLRLQFRSARRFGYGASPGMVRRCLERCDAAGITGRVEVLRVLSDTRPVGTQGPVWQIEGRMV